MGFRMQFTLEIGTMTVVYQTTGVERDHKRKELESGTGRQPSTQKYKIVVFCSIDMPDFAQPFNYYYWEFKFT